MNDIRRILGVILKKEGMIGSVPIIIDDIKEYEGFKMSRCCYFSIEFDDLGEDWVLGFSNMAIPFMMIGLQGIISSPVGNYGSFNTASDIEYLFNLIEGNDNGLYVDVNDIWVPNSAFKDEEYFKIGSTYRMGYELFRLCYNFRNQRISKTEFLESSIEYTGQLDYSKIETESFRTWEKNQIEEARINYEENREMALEYIDNTDESGDYENEGA